MPEEFKSTQEGAVEPDVGHPDGGPSAADADAGRPVTPPVGPGEPQAPVSPPAGGSQRPVSSPAGHTEAPAHGAPAEDPAGTAAPAQEPEGFEVLAREPEGADVPVGDPDVPVGDPEAPVGPAVSETAGQSGGREDDEQQLEADLEELTARAEKADQYLELAKRTKADFENYRKRAAREAAAAQERGIAKLARELLPAVDNLDRALQAVESAPAGNPAAANGADTLVSGIKLVHADVLAGLQRAGIERYSPEGEAFDPERHEAIAQQPVEGTRPGTIVEVYQQGYRLGESVIRPARVVVAA